MVGVPRSKGCSLCRKRRIRCRKYGAACPGYKRSLKFQDEGPRLQERYLITSPDTDGSDEGLSPVSDSLPVKAQRQMRCFVGPSLDERVCPSLAYKSFLGQQPRLFKEFVCASFPTMYYHNEFRFGPGFTFPDNVVKKFGSKPYYDATVMSLSIAWLAHQTKDPNLEYASRQKYAEALSGIKYALTSEDTVSDALLMAVILLAFYEMNVRTTEDAWLFHANAVKQLMKKRGMRAHLSGPGRVCHFAFRPFLIGAALQKGESCFLDEDSWQDLAASLRSEDSRKQNEWAFYIDVYETIFMELVKCPGYIKEAREIVSVTSPEAKSLAQRIRTTCDRLRRLSKEMRTLLSAHNQRKQGITLRFVGPEPKLFPDTSPSLLLRAGVDAVRILEQILDRITIPTPTVEQTLIIRDGAITPVSSPGSSGDADSPPLLSFGLSCELGNGPQATVGNDAELALTWLDRVAGAMGLLGAEITYGMKPGIQTDLALRTVRTLTPVDDDLPEPRRSSD
ncbi:hypothetical protein ANOM_001304 [Aspergillus nomiae NRRL 13137]|uniref:Zn(2)-C6 fungal-type domain-containing protein n=1 Tax=Aspergillus nomiae NRRL (strain ATCC 15546 / NRRL 13137 / CBS 260.88 / M93) TaxID=1509407 RepID=A0A0L1JFR8_ASPN3|nr:uncharacterized protein ANOM_001304 [Aspergillus nomiae NRRL 13137]KNG90610.1 hypothetical protein ANOM_001304 [Aspergillus nomiae NRRL 13137]